jgi:seryl-tRNA synthetase
MNLLVRSTGSDALARLAGELFCDMGVDGVYARSARYEAVVRGLSTAIDRHRAPDAEVLRFPPVMSRAQLEKSGYLGSFPGLLGCVCGLHGEAAIDAAVARFGAGGDWTGSLSACDLVLAPAACYPLYPMAASRGPVPASGWRFDVAADCFRREPSRDPDRLQSFRMREYVCIGDTDRVLDFRDGWIDRAQGLARALGLAYTVEPASDPFFGRVGRMKAVSQKQQALKLELLVPLRGEAGQPTACMSFNYHRDHFGQAWDIRTASGAPAHSACVAFGMDRLALAMFQAHGTDIAGWPGAIQDLLGLPHEGG